MGVGHALALILVAAVPLAGCGSVGGSGGPGASPGPTGSGGTGAIAHKTGATDLILRFDERGGFVAPSYFATQAPIFSLYGDGTAIFRDPTAPAPSPEREIIRGVPYRTVRLTEAQLQALLTFALADGGLAAAADHYDRPIADAPSAVFTIEAGSRTKTVSVNGLGIDVGGQPSPAILAQLQALANRLQHFASEAPGATIWSPDRYRGILGDDSFGTRINWPWATIQPQEFVQRTEPDAPPFRIRTLTPADVALLGLTGAEGGLQGIVLVMPSDQTFSFRLRPLLPDEPY